MEASSKLRPLAAFVAALGWLTLALQLYLSIRLSIERNLGALYGVAIYLAFFTILTNVLAALVLTLSIVAPKSRLGRFCATPETVAGVAANIALVGIAYNLLLRNVWHPQGWQLVADVLLHDVVPILFVFYAWLHARRDGGASYVSRACWAAWPVVYFVYAMARGIATDFYPYPFLNLARLGYVRLLENAVGIVIGYFAIAAVLWLLDRVRVRRSAIVAR